MTSLPSPPNARDLADFALRLRRRETSARDTTAHFLARIAALDGKLGALTYNAREQATAAAHALDELLRAGTDLGPLMGVPVLIKDLYTVSGMPTTAGSRLDIADLVQPEGYLVTALKRAGCVILGKTVTTEFALGMYNLTHRSPWNPCDMDVARMTGGSSSGSAVAMAAGFATFTMGSDTGGSVRAPAALCGVFGFKASPGLWPADGIFPLAPTLDSPGFFSASAQDAAIIFSVLSNQPVPVERPVQGLRLGRPVNHFFDELDPAVATAVDGALAALEKAGAEIIPFEIKEATEIDPVFAQMVPAELIATLGKDRFLQGKEVMDPVAWERAIGGLDLSAVEYNTLLRRYHALCRIAAEKTGGFDAWITPTVPAVAPSVADFTTVDTVAAWNKRATHNTRPINLFSECAVSVPLAGPGLPVGLQIVGANGQDATLLSIALGVERALHAPPFSG
jgi:aspartyl-tRNA(Asn)/glutamyl-tRNA(Gln) amidotransferase subunit A